MARSATQADDGREIRTVLAIERAAGEKSPQGVPYPAQAHGGKNHETRRPQGRCCVMLAVEVEKALVCMHAVPAHPPARTFFCEMNNLRRQQVVDPPARSAQSDAVVQVFQVHKESFIQSPDLR